ncbi:MAG: TIGR04282 family arsenosugar biosynthesis glycosyltransferase [Candidatus Hydrogenedentota bacterium]
MNARVMLFTRYPVPGATKTRLIPTLGAEGAAQLHRELTERIATCMQSPVLSDISMEVCYTGGSRDEMEEWLGPRFTYRAQCEGDLGDRLRDAFSAAFLEGHRVAIAIGSDVPGITPKIFRHAVDRLKFLDAIIGPASDGGYYLIGMNRFLPELFDEIAWGTETVFKETMSRVSSSSLTHEVLEELSDVDRPEDLDLVQDMMLRTS